MDQVNKASILVLYRRFPGYMLACVQHFARKNGYEAHIVKYPKDPLSPFSLSSNPELSYYNREEMNLQALTKLADSIKPSAVLVSGWGDSLYNQMAKKLKRDGVAVICLMDNQWEGSLKQRLLTGIGKVILKRYFTHLWVAGMYQYEFGRRLGFPREKIFTNVYSADVHKFYQDNQPTPARRFVFVGRLVEVKGIDLLLAAISLLERQDKTDGWKFYFIGNGPLASQIPKKDHIIHIPFMQPEELGQFASEGGVFILPSRFEPWGVVVHEFAAAGFPIITSEKVGARAAFVRNGYNGFVCRSEDVQHLYQTIKKVMEMPLKNLSHMGEKSKTLAQVINPEVWSNTLTEIIESQNN